MVVNYVFVNRLGQHLYYVEADFMFSCLFVLGQVIFKWYRLTENINGAQLLVIFHCFSPVLTCFKR
jgi:hypothetical protein